jgi:hypothetical protein
MLRIEGLPRSACDGISRRTLLEAAGAGLFGMSVPGLLAVQSQAASVAARAKSVIFVFLFGGPSQLETFDLKTDAPERIRGPFRPIASHTAGLRISEHLPRLASISELYCVVRTMTHTFNDHSGAAHYLQTGKIWHVPIGGGFNPTPRDWPAMGAVVEYLSQRRPSAAARDLPSYAVVPNSLGRLQEAGQYLRPGEYAGWLGRRYNPLTTRIDKKDRSDNPYWRDCSDLELTFQIDGLAAGDGIRLDRLERRTSLLSQFDAQRRALDRGAGVRDYSEFRRRALGLVSSEQTRRALDLRAEPRQIRDRYGRHLFGQSALIARRLVEAGARFVTVHYDACDGYGWDSHVHSDDVKNHLMPTFDQGFAALLTDLHQRGLLAETLVVALGEMGRTPLANARWGRGHWSTLFPAVLAGAGIRGGTVYGASDKDAAHVVEHPVTPENLAATIYHALGIPSDLRLNDHQGRPIPIVEGGKPVLDLFG